MSKRSTQRSRLDYAHHSHREFNERLAAGRKKDPHDAVKSHWMKPETLSRLPQNKASFEEARDPQIAKQQTDLRKAKGKRSTSLMIKRQKPMQVLRPPLSLSLGPDRAAFNAQLQADDRRAHFMERRKSPQQIARSRSRNT